jgi:benzoyl-CoA reductase/2-hydroxyglutaryl-CoA dehydratase subunit BcrC/BadD/HgdB
MNMNQTEGMNSKQLLGHYINKSFADAQEAKANGKLICWSSSVAPDEFCRAMDIEILYPENMAAAVGAKKGAPDMLKFAEQKGYNVDICSYARVNLGYLELLKEYAKTGKKSEALENYVGDYAPLPDVVISTNLCGTLLKWFENIAAELNIPCIVIDVPFNYERPMPQRMVDYVKGQFEYAKEQLAKLCGRPFDEEKFLEIQKQSQKAVAAWDKMASMTSHKPSPFNGFDYFNYMALIVSYRATLGAEETFTKAVEELEQMVKNGESAFGDNEKYRVAWEGIAVWPYLGHTFKTFKSMGTDILISGRCIIHRATLNQWLKVIPTSIQILIWRSGSNLLRES